MIDLATPYWSFIRASFSDAQIKIGLTFLVHELFYWLIYLPYFVAEKIPAFQTYKLQSNRPFTPEKQWNCFKSVLVSHVVVEVPLMVVGHFAFHAMGMGMNLPLPTMYNVAGCVIGSFLIEDFYFYWIHRLLHHGWWYQKIHKIHHEHPNPFGMAAEYAHPLETLFLGVGTVLGPALLCNHVFTMHVWVIFRLLQTIECHTGYDFPWSPRQWIPFYGGSEYHDFHHETFKGNYASTLIIWDYVFGTDVQYRNRRKKLEAQGKPARATLWDPLLYRVLFPTPPLAADKDGADSAADLGKAEQKSK